jgi:hypothetical protein
MTAPDPAWTLEPGALIDGRYAVLSQLGAGGYGVVYRARQVSTGQDVALKQLHVDRLTPAQADGVLRRFEREMQVIARLHHPNVVRLLDAGRLGDAGAFLVLEYVEGEDLAHVLAREGALAPREAVALLGEVADALAAAHAAGIVHRDLKPQNVMITRSGPRRHATVLDFGIAAIIDEARGADYATLTATGEVVGTPVYVAPEQLQGQVTPASDLYAWGLMLLECLTGQRAVPARTPIEALSWQLSPSPVVIPGDCAPPELLRIVARATAKALPDRYASATEVLADLERLSLPAGPSARVSPPAAADGCADTVASPSPPLARPAAVTAVATTVALPVETPRSPAAGGKPARRRPRRRRLRWAAGLLLLVLALVFTRKHCRDRSGAAPLRVELKEQGDSVSTGHALWAVAVRPDGREVATGGDDGNLRLWDVDTRKETRRLSTGTFRVTDLAYAPDGRRLVVATMLPVRVAVHDLTTGKTTWSMDQTDPVEAVAFGPTGDRIAYAAGPQVVTVLDPSRPATVQRHTGHQHPLTALAFSDDGALLAGGGWGRSVLVWKVGQERPLHTFFGPADRITALAFLRRARSVVSASADGTVRRHRLHGSRKARTLSSGSGPVMALVAHPRHALVVAGGDAGTLWLHDLEANRRAGEAPHGGGVRKLARSADGSRLASIGSDGRLHFWSLTVE